jgi:hypothetical protein
VGLNNALTAREVSVIRALALAGHTAADIARRIGRNASCVIKHAPECGQRYFNWTTWTVSKVPAPVQKRAEAAAAQYGMDVPTLIYEIAAGTLMRGSVDRSLQRYARYENSRKLDVATSHNTEERKRAGEDQAECDLDCSEV